MHINKNIRLFRKVLGWEQEELAKRIGISRNSISGYERSINVPEYNRKLLAQAFGISESDLVNKEWTLEEVQKLYPDQAKNDTTSRKNGENTLSASAADNFTNDMSRRFYYYYQKRFEDKTLSRKEVGKDLELGEHSYSYEFWTLMRKGKVGVGLEHLITAKQKHNLNPLYILGMSDVEMLAPGEDPAQTAAAEADVSYGTETHKVGPVIDQIFDKHKTPRVEYAEKRLKMTPRNLQRIIAGEVNPSFAQIELIADDHAESLDIFRRRPLPKGHLLQLIEEKDKQLILAHELITTLRASAK